jgi:hypothetical protein
MSTSEQTNEIAAALAKAQGEIANPTKDSENPHFRSHYADLSAGINAVREALSRNGIAFVQCTRLADDVLMVDTRLTHASGQWIESEFPACRFPAKPQEVGSALTYARRYSLFAMVGIAGEDDDGNAASATETPAVKRRAVAPPPPPKDPPFSEEGSRIAGNQLIAALDMAESVDELTDWRRNNDHTIQRLLTGDKDRVRDAYNAAKAKFQTKEAA